VSGRPKSFQEFVDQAEAIDKLGPDIYEIGLQLSVDEYAADTLHMLLWENGGDILDKAGKPAVSSPGTVKTIKLLKDLVDAKTVPFGEEVRNFRTLFAQGKAGFFFEGPWIQGVLAGEGMDRDKWDVAQRPGYVTPASHILCMSKQSKNKDLAWDEFIISLTIMDKNSMRTIPVGIIQSFAGEFSIKWGEMMAASVITAIPVVLIFIFLSKHLIGGLTSGAVKG
jgi:maltose-binding protein MalE